MPALRLLPRPAFQCLFIGLIAILAACGSGKHGAAGPVTLRVGDQLHTLETMLQAAGEDGPRDYRIQWSNFLGGPAVIAAETGNSVDLSWMYETPVVFAQAAGSPIKVIAVARPTRPGASKFALVVAPDSPIHTVADLRGRKVGFMPGTETQYLVVRLLAQAGMSYTDIRPVTVVNIGTTMLANGTVDATVAGDPHLSQMLIDGKVRIVAMGGEPVTPDLQYVVVSNRALGEPSLQSAMGDFILRISRSLRYREEKTAAAVPTYALAFGLPIPVIEQYLKRAPAHFTPIDHGVIEAQQTLADTFFELGLVPRRSDAAKLFDHRYDALVVKAQNLQ